MGRTSLVAIAAAGVALGLGAGGWAAAEASNRGAAPASDGRLVIRYEVRRAPAYTPPPPSEATRLDVLSATPATTVDDGVLSAQAAAAYRSLQAEDDARRAAALADIRAQDAVADRETARALERLHAESARQPGEDAAADDDTGA